MTNTEPIKVKDALRLVEMAIEETGRECTGLHRGRCGEGLHHHHDGWCEFGSLSRAVMRPLIELLQAELEFVIESCVIVPAYRTYPPLAALRDYYDRVRPDWREGK